MQADEVQNAKEPIAAQIDLSGQTLRAANKTSQVAEIPFPRASSLQVLLGVLSSTFAH